MNQKISILEAIAHSGIVLQFILLILAMGSVYSWAILLKKKKSIQEFKDGDVSFLKIYYETSNLNEIFLVAKQQSASACALMFRRGYEELLKINQNISEGDVKERLKDHFEKFGFQSLERALRKGKNELNEKLESLLIILASIGSVGPFVGLLGTVLGIIHSFMGLSEGQATLDAVAPGIAEALVATAVGLMAAIPAVIFYNYLNNEIAKINVQVDSFAQDFLNLIERSLVNTKRS